MGRCFFDVEIRSEEPGSGIGFEMETYHPVRNASASRAKKSSSASPSRAGTEKRRVTSDIITRADNGRGAGIGWPGRRSARLLAKQQAIVEYTGFIHGETFC